MTARSPNIVLAVALAAATCVAALTLPAQAQPNSAFGLHFAWPQPEAESFEPPGVPLGICKTDLQIREAIAARGYADIFLNVAEESRIQVRASMDGWVYLLDYDFCTDTIVERTELRPE